MEKTPVSDAVQILWPKSLLTMWEDQHVEIQTRSLVRQSAGHPWIYRSLVLWSQTSENINQQVVLSKIYLFDITSLKCG